MVGETKVMTQTSTVTSLQIIHKMSRMAHRHEWNMSQYAAYVEAVLIKIEASPFCQTYVRWMTEKQSLNTFYEDAVLACVRQHLYHLY